MKCFRRPACIRECAARGPDKAARTKPVHGVHRRLFAFCSFLLAIALSVPMPARSATNVPLYGVFELTLTAQGNYANPYLEMPGDSTTPGFVVGAFIGPDGRMITIDGFWDGGHTWKIRMAPTITGTWTYSTSSSDPGLNGKTGTFDVSPSSSNGFVKVDPSHPHHFVWTNGRPFYFAPVSMMVAHFDESTRTAQGGLLRVDNGGFQTLAQTRADQGFDATYWGFFAFNKPQFANKTQQNEGGPPFISYDPTRLNPTYFHFADQRVQALESRGIMVMFSLGWPDQGIMRTVGDTNLKRMWRYFIARYAAYNVTWNLFGEVQEFGSNYESIANDYGNMTRRWDPYDHPITTHTLNTTLAPDFLRQPWMDYITLQQPTAATSDYLAYGKPVLNAEYGGYEQFQVSGAQLRPMVWNVRMHGGYFVYESWGNNPKSSGANYASLCNSFFEKNTKFWLLEYHPELFSGTPGLADPGSQYVTYLKNGGSIRVDLSGFTASFNVSWYNPRTGIMTQAGTISAGGWRTFNSPNSNDWVLYLSGGPGENLPPTSSFTASLPSGTTSITVGFDGSASSDPDGSIVSYQWSFGDGTTANGVRVSHVYTARGTFSAKLTVTDNAGATSSAQRTITAGSAPQLSQILLTPDTVSLRPGATKAFTAEGVDQFGNPFPITPQWLTTGGTIDSPGVFTAGTAEGTYTITATSGTVSGTVNVKVDNTPPTLASATLTNSSTLQVSFSEPVDVGSASLVANYTISSSDGNTIPVNDTTNSASNAAAGMATLLTGPHAPGVLYTLTVRGVTDLAGNPIAARSSVTYREGGAAVLSSASATSGHAYTWGSLVQGAPVYTDRSYGYTDLPTAYVGLRYLQTSNDDKTIGGSGFLTFSTDRQITVYVGYDTRLTSVPAWLATWTDAGATITTSANSFHLYRKEFPAGTVTLGGNASTDANSMYVVLVGPSGSTSPPPIPPNRPLLGALPTDLPLQAHLIAPAFNAPTAAITLAGTEWQIAKAQNFAETSLLLDRETSNPGDLSVPPGVLKTSASYWIRVRQHGNNGLWSAWSQEMPFGTQSTDPNDVDQNGTDDRYQVNSPVDTTGSGIPDAQQGMCDLHDAESGSVVGFKASSGSLQCLTSVPLSRVSSVSGVPGALPYGLFAFSIRGLPVDPAHPATVQVTVYFPNPLPNGTQWYRYDTVSGTMQDLSPQVSISGRAAAMTLTDGGPNDADGTVNGTIVDPSGPVQPPMAAPPTLQPASMVNSSALGGGGAFGPPLFALSILFAILKATAALRPRMHESNFTRHLPPARGGGTTLPGAHSFPGSVIQRPTTHSRLFRLYMDVIEQCFVYPPSKICRWRKAVHDLRNHCHIGHLDASDQDVSEQMIEHAASEKKVDVLRATVDLETVITARPFETALCERQAVCIVRVVKNHPHRLKIRTRKRQDSAHFQHTVSLVKEFSEISDRGKMLYYLVGIDQIDRRIGKREWRNS